MKTQYILWGKASWNSEWIKLTHQTSKAEQKRWQKKGYETQLVEKGCHPFDAPAVPIAPPQGII